MSLPPPSVHLYPSTFLPSYIFLPPSTNLSIHLFFIFPFLPFPSKLPHLLSDLLHISHLPSFHSIHPLPPPSCTVNITQGASSIWLKVDLNINWCSCDYSGNEDESEWVSECVHVPASVCLSDLSVCALSVAVSVHICLSIYVCLFPSSLLSACIASSVCLSLFLFVSVCRLNSLSVCLFALPRLSVCFFLCVCLHRLSPSVCLSVCLYHPVCLFACLGWIMRQVRCEVIDLML